MLSDALLCVMHRTNEKLSREDWILTDAMACVWLYSILFTVVTSRNLLWKLNHPWSS